MPPIVERLQFQAVVIDHAVGGDRSCFVLEQIQGRHPAINLVVLCRRHSTAVYGQGMAFPNPLQIREVGDHRGLLAAECQVDEVLDAGQVQFEGHGFKLGVLTIGKAVQPLGQIIQLVHVDGLAVQPFEGRV